MYISLQCLQNLIDLNSINIDTNLFENKIGLVGFEIEEFVTEEILKRKNVRMKIATTANRPDVLYLGGISREIFYIFQTPWIQYKNFQRLPILKQFKLNNSYTDKNDFIFETNIDPACMEFVCLNLNLSTPIKIPKWIKRRLIASNFNCSNTLVDLTNYVTLEWGCCFQCYDLDKLQLISNQKKNIFSTEFLKEKTEIILSQTDQEQILKSGTLVDMFNGKCIGISGIDVDQEFAITPESKRVIICVQSFNLRKIRNSIRNSGLQNQQTISHERQVGYLHIPLAIKRLKTLIYLLTPTTLQTIKVIKLGNENYKKTNLINVRIYSVLSILGNLNKNSYDEQKQIIINLIKNSDCKIEEIKTDSLLISVPHYRSNDLKEEIDIIEELARGFGFNNFVALLPYCPYQGKVSKSNIIEEKIRKFFLSYGFFETFHTSFCEVNEKSPRLLNPITSEFSYLRPNLIEGFINQLSYNSKNNKNLTNYFEIGSTFYKSKEEKILEAKRLGGMITGIDSNASWNSNLVNLDWFVALGLIQSLLKNLKINNFTQSKRLVTLDSYFHPNQLVEIQIEDQILGYFGLLNPKISQARNLDKNIYIFEFDFALLNQFTELNYSTQLKYESYSTFPTLSQNFLIKLTNSINYAIIEKEIKEITGDILSNIQIFNIQKTELNYVMGLKLIFQSNEKTLNKVDIDELVFLIQEKLKKKYKVVFL